MERSIWKKIASFSSDKIFITAWCFFASCKRILNVSSLGYKNLRLAFPFCWNWEIHFQLNNSAMARADASREIRSSENRRDDSDLSNTALRFPHWWPKKNGWQDSYWLFVQTESSTLKRELSSNNALSEGNEVRIWTRRSAEGYLMKLIFYRLKLWFLNYQIDTDLIQMGKRNLEFINFH